jgi:hypothetical protein
MRLLHLLPLAALAGCGGGNMQNTDGGTGCSPGQIKFGAVCLTAPTMPAARTACGDVTEFCDATASMKPNLGCLSAGPKNHPPTPATVTMTGFVHPFSSGKSNATVTIQVYRASDLLGVSDISMAQPIVPAIMIGFDPSTANDLTTFRACDADSHVGCVPVSGGCMPPCTDGLTGRPDTPQQYCRDFNGVPTCESRLRWEPRFAIPGLPTNTQLVIRSSGANGMSDGTWATLVAWNVFLASDDKSCGGDPQATDCLDTTDMANPKYQLNVNVLSQSDYFNIPFTSGLSSGITKGQGAVAGEVHDCDNVRLGNVQVGVQPQGDRFTYFNGDPYMTIPDSSRAGTGTDRLGLFSSLNVTPGKIAVESAALVDGMTVSAGTFSAMLYPDSVAVVNLNGGKQ